MKDINRISIDNKSPTRMKNLQSSSTTANLKTYTVDLTSNKQSSDN